jgi:hypothetical protein
MGLTEVLQVYGDVNMKQSLDEAALLAEKEIAKSDEKIKVAKKIAKKLLALDISLDMIMQATSLSVEQITEITEVIGGFNETLSIRADLRVNVKRVFLDQCDFTAYKLIAIQNSAFDSVGRCIRSDYLMLPKLYAALTYLSGPGDNYYDDYKGSYSFAFELEVNKNSNISNYLYIMYHYRSFIDFSIMQILPKTDSKIDPIDASIMHKPNDELFSNMDICQFSVHFFGYAIGYIKGLKYEPEPFVKYLDSNFLIFGYCENEYFFKSYEDQEQYIKEKSKLQTVEEIL